MIVPRSSQVDIPALMDHLFATTDLERSYRVNLNMIGLDGRPQVKNLATILQEWLAYREETVRKRLGFRLEKILARLHLLEGFLIVYLHIDEVIALIREADAPKDELIRRYPLSLTQAEAILEIRLRQLAKLEEIKIRTEQKHLSKERDQLQKILGSKTQLKQLLRTELKKDAEQFGDERQSPLVVRQAAQAFQKVEMIPAEAMTLILSTRGWIRAAKGHDFDVGGLNFKTGDSLKSVAKGDSRQLVAFIDQVAVIRRPFIHYPPHVGVVSHSLAVLIHRWVRSSSQWSPVNQNNWF